MNNTTPAPTDEEIVVVPSDTDIEFLFEKTTGHLFVQHRVDFLAFARAVLAKWGAQPAASPAPLLAREPLTDEQIMDEASHHGFIGNTVMLVKFIRGIEAAHGIIEGAS